MGVTALTQQKADLLQGTLDMLILKAVSLGPLHGYGIIQRIRQMSGEMLEVEQGSLYPAIYRIEQRGWADDRYVTVAWGRDYADVPPVKGVIFTDARSSSLSVEVDVAPVDDP